MADQKITELTELTTPEANDMMIIVDDPSGTPVTKKITVGNSMVDASTTVKGKASFNSSDFSVSSGAVSLKNKTSYWSAPGCAVINDDATGQYSNGNFTDESNTNEAFLPVNLPNGAVVTSVRVDGAVNSATGWVLYRKSGSTDGTAMASGNIAGAADTSISVATIDNNNYTYFIEFTDMDGTIYLTEIAYTTDYI